MWGWALRRAPWAVLLMGLAGWLAAVAAPADDKTSAADPPAGLLLIASQGLQDPRFSHTVILLVRHDRGGALGIMINRPVGTRPIATVLAESKGKEGAGDGKQPGSDAAVEGSIKVYLGGPVQRQFGFVIHSADYRRPETLAVTGQLAMTATRGVLRDIGQHKGPAKYLFALGYAGWGKGQLEGEIARRDWFTTVADPELVFDSDRDALWQTALDRRTRQL